MSRLLSRLGLIRAPWPWVRAALILILVVSAVFVWNPDFTVWRDGGYTRWNRNALSLLAIGATFIGCLESLRDKRT
jgi:hypothetical protein